MNASAKMGRRVARAAMPLLTGFFALGSVLVILVVAEGMLRIGAGQPLNRLQLGVPAPVPKDAIRPLVSVAEKYSVDADVDPSWIDVQPPPLPGRRQEDARTIELANTRPAAAPYADPSYRQWNADWVRYWGCRGKKFVRTLANPVLIFDSPGTGSRPIYRHLLDFETPAGLVTNRYGWRGGPISLNKQEATVRIAFVGASTTIGHPGFPYSFPEYVIHWLNLWSKKHQTGVRFDGINAGRAGLTSTDVAAIVETEIMPMEPDLVFYYEGANQFRLDSLIEEEFPTKDEFEATLTPPWRRSLAEIEQYSIVGQRLANQVDRLRSKGGREPQKPEYTLAWPKNVDEWQPDLDDPELPVNLSTIVRDLRKIRRSTSSGGSDLAIGSFVWRAYDGMRLDPVRDRWSLYFFAQNFWPFRYADIRRLADFQNRIFALFAAQNDAVFVEIAGAFPMDHGWFIDGVHFSSDGIRLQAWFVLQGILPTIRERIRDGKWPRADEHFLLAHPYIATPRPVESPCDRLEETW